MTSKADRKRRKRASRKASQKPVAVVEMLAPKSPPHGSPPASHGRLMTDLQEAALHWFSELRHRFDAGGPEAAAARRRGCG